MVMAGALTRAVAERGCGGGLAAGVYYQAEIAGQSITWIVPYPFAQTVRPIVDAAIVLSSLGRRLTRSRAMQVRG